MNQHTASLIKITKASPLSHWNYIISLDNENNLVIPVKKRSDIYVNTQAQQLINDIDDLPTHYPFEYNMISVSDKAARECYLEIIGNKPTAFELSLSASKYIKKNIKQTNWVPEEEIVPNLTNLNVSQTINLINSQAIIKLEDYKIRDLDENTQRFWLFFEREKLTVKSSNIIEGYISGYAWPAGVSIPRKYNGFSLIENDKPIRIKYTGIEDVLPQTDKGYDLNEYGLTKKYQLPQRELKEISNEATKFNELLVGQSDILAVSLQYNYKTMSLKVDNRVNALEGIVYGTGHQQMSKALETIAKRQFHGYNLNKELLKPLYSKHKELIKLYSNSQPMPVVLFDDEYPTKTYGIAIHPWVEELSIKNNPIQLKSISALLDDTPLNDLVLTERITDKEILAISQEARKKLKVKELGGSMDSYKVYNNPLTEPPESEEETEETEEEKPRVTPEETNFDKELSVHKQQYLNNDNNIPPFDDRLYNGEIYNRSIARKEQLPYDYRNRVRIGDVFIPIPPTSIRMDKQYQSKKVNTMRAKSALQTGVANTRNVITLNIYYANLEDINGTEKQGYRRPKFSSNDSASAATYYMDGLRPLIAQFKKAPFLPIDNEYINLSLGVHNVVLRNLQVETVPGFPEALKATLILEEFDLQPYIIGETQLGSLINYPLLRYHYQRSLHQVNPLEPEPYKTYLPPLTNLTNDFEFFIIDENSLASRNQLAKSLRAMQTPQEYRIKREQELTGEEVLDSDGNVISEDPGKDKLSQDGINYIKKLYQDISTGRDQLQKYQNEFTKKTEATNFGLEGKYTKLKEIPVIPGGFKSDALKLTDKEIKYGHRMAVVLYGQDDRYLDSKLDISNIPNPTDSDAGRQSKEERLFIPQHLLSSEYTSYYQSPEGIVFLPDYKKFISEGRNRKGALNAITEKELPGFYVVDFPRTGNSGVDTVRKELLDRDDIVNYNGKNTYIIPAGDPEIEALLDELTQEYRKFLEDINNYQEEYNKLIEKLNQTEDEIEKIEYPLSDITPVSMTVSLENTFSTSQVQAAETPTMQFFGGSEPEVLITFETTNAGVNSIETMFRRIGRYVKEYREGIVSGFLGIVNPLINMFGITDIIPVNVQYDTIENFPDRRMVTIVASAFDKTQRRQESIYGFVGGNIDDTMMDRAYNSGYDPNTDRQYVNRYMSQMELYPDLELPKVEELDFALQTINSGVNSWNNRTNQLFVDPDFYVATNMTLKKIANTVLYGVEEHELRTQDSRGYITDTLLYTNQAGGGPEGEAPPRGPSITNFVATGKSGKDFETEGAKADYADPKLLWENYGNEHKFKPVIIGVTHGDLSGNGGGGGGSSVSGDPNDYSSGTGRATANIPDGLIDLPIEADIITNAGNRTGGNNNELLGITLHDTGSRAAGADARMHSNYQKAGAEGRQASWHYQVDDKLAIQSFEHTTQCYHAGDGSKAGGGNMATIGIEMCVNSDGDFDMQVYNTAVLMAGLCFVHGWNPLTDIRTHQDCDGKHCPNELLNGRNGWSVQEVYELTNDLLGEIKSKNGQGVPLETEKYVNASHVPPSYQTWLSWQTENNKNRADYNSWVQDQMNNRVNQEDVWFKLSDLIIKHFGPDLLAGEAELHHIQNRTAPYKNPSAIVSNRSEPLNLEEQYLGHTPLGQLSFATSDSIFKTRMNNEYGETNTRLINGRNETLVDEPLNIPKSEQDSFHRILSYLQALIRVESGGALTKLGQPILKDLNNKGVPTKGGFIGAKLTDGIDKNTAERLLWDWEYNLEHVVTLLADTYHLAKENNNKEIRINALEWAIASQSWVELPDILYANNSEYDTARGYANGKIDPLRNNLFKEVELNRNMHIAENFKQDTVPVLYTGLDNRQINNVFFIYEGLSPTQSMLMTSSVRPMTMSASAAAPLAATASTLSAVSALPTGNAKTLSNSLQPLSASSGFNSSSGKFLPRNANNPFEQYRKIAKEKAEKEAADLLNSGELGEGEVDDFVQDAIKDALEDAPNIGTITDEEADELLGESGERGGGGREGGADGPLEGSEMSQHHTPWNNLQSIEGMYVDMLSYDQTGRLLRAFPTFIVQLIDEGKWFSNFRTWDNFYGYNALQSIDVHKSRKIVADTAIVTMSNMYGGLTAKREDMGYDALNKPSFFSNTFWSQYVFGNPSEETFDQRKNLAQSMSLRPGARLHIRMGYGADPFGLPIVFNGTIAEISTGDIVTILAQGDGIELTNAIVGDEQDTTDWLRNVKAPRDFIGKVMTSKGNWLKDILNNATEAFIFKVAPSGIAHFGSDISTEAGNILPWSDDYGESLMNVYTNDGTGAKSTFHNENGHYIGAINYYMEYLNPTSISSFLFESGGAFDEHSVLLSIYGHSLWDIVQTYALTAHDYHAAVVPFEYRSTLFFGKNHWPMIYAFDSAYGYDASTGEWGRSVKQGGWLMKTFMQAHVVSSRYNLISNEIKASADGVYNNVVVEYDGHNTPLIQADSDIRYDQQKTAYIQGTMLTRHDKQLGESVRNFFTTEVQAATYGHSTVRDFMKDMYKGSYIMLGEASVKPHDLMYMSDTIQDLQGIHLVKGVHHSMSIDTGFISTVEPDAYVVNFDTEGLAIGELAWTLGKEITGRTLLAGFRPSILESETGTFSENITSAVMNKLMDVASNRHNYPFAKSYNRGYLAALTRKSKGMLFKQIGHQLSDPVILDYANRIFDTENRLLGSDTRGLLQYMNNYNESKYPESIKRYIQEQKETQEATKKFRFNQKEYFNGINIDESMAAIVANGKKASQDLNSFWEAYEREEALVAPNNPDTSVPPGQDPGLVEQSSTLSPQINGVVGKLLDVRKNIPENMLWTPFKILNSSIDNLWTNKKQNSECVKIIPMTYKGTEFIAAMEGHRGGVWGDTPSDWDKWFNLEFGDNGGHPVTGLLSRWLNALGDFY